MRRGTSARADRTRGCPTHRTAARWAHFRPLACGPSASADLLRIFVPLHALTNPCAQLPLRRLRLGVDPLAQIIQARRDDRLVVRRKLKALNSPARPLDVHRGRPPKAPVPGAELRDVVDIDSVVILGELVPMEEI